MTHGDKHTDSDQLMPIGAVVARLQERYPDITHSSLRFLEREGMVLPARTPGGHRLYGEADISRIIQIKEWQRQHLPLDVIRERLSELQGGIDLPALAEAFIERGLAGRFLGAGRLLLEANDRGVSMPDLFANVLEPALVEVGNRWEAGTLLVAQEKQFSETSREVIADLTQRHAWVDPARPSILAACVQGNRHELGLRMIVGILRSEGWPVHFLGADVAPLFLLQAIRLHHPRLILLSADRPERVAELDAVLKALRDASPEIGEIPVVIGGGIVSVSTNSLDPGGQRVVYDEGLRDVLVQIRRILSDVTATGGA